MGLLKEWEEVLVALIFVGVLVLLYKAAKDSGFVFKSPIAETMFGQAHALRFQSPRDDGFAMSAHSDGKARVEYMGGGAEPPVFWAAGKMSDIVQMNQSNLGADPYEAADATAKAYAYMPSSENFKVTEIAGQKLSPY